MMLANHADATACDNMTFDFSTADLPDYTDKALPSFAFSTKPEVETISVQHGVEQE